MKILSDRKYSGGWITAIVCGRWVQAKVFDEPSTYGINDGHVSKLVIGKTDKRDVNRDFLEQMCYNYDRGLDFDNAGSMLVNEIVKQLEAHVKPPIKLDEDLFKI